jgi:hypothetical protein
MPREQFAVVFQYLFQQCVVSGLGKGTNEPYHPIQMQPKTNGKSKKDDLHGFRKPAIDSEPKASKGT